jgi:hypothetical protein
MIHFSSYYIDIKEENNQAQLYDVMSVERKMFCVLSLENAQMRYTDIFVFVGKYQL